MKSELTLSKSNRKVDVNIIGGGDTQILISIPRIKDELIFFYPNEEVKISYYDTEHVFNFSTSFNNLNERHGVMFYTLFIKDFFNTINYRKEFRTNVDIPCMIFSDSKNQLCTILDLNSKGLKIESFSPIEEKKVVVLYETDTEKWLTGEIVWSKRDRDLYHYGVKLDA